MEHGLAEHSPLISSTKAGPGEPTLAQNEKSSLG
jgi:hypothetical protein